MIHDLTMVTQTCAVRSEDGAGRETEPVRAVEMKELLVVMF